MIRFLMILPALVASFAQAESITNEAGASLFTGDYLLQIVGSFLLVICALLAVMVLMKRFNAVGTSSSDCIRVVASAPLGQRERAVLLQIGTEQILVGVASGNVTILHKCADLVAPVERDASLSFKEVWNFARSRQGGQR
jgi:flagellar protein FliO/FliZ